MLELGYKAELEALETLSPMLLDLLLRDDYLKWPAYGFCICDTPTYLLRALRTFL